MDRDDHLASNAAVLPTCSAEEIALLGFHPGGLLPLHAKLAELTLRLRRLPAAERNRAVRRLQAMLMQVQTDPAAADAAFLTAGWGSDGFDRYWLSKLTAVVMDFPTVPEVTG
jgi:hypothetical protein